MTGASFPDAPIPMPMPERPMVWGYGGFWWRFLAGIIDFTVLVLADELLRAVTGFRRFGVSVDDATPPGEDDAFSHVAYTVTTTMPHWHTHGGLTALLSLLVSICYYVLLQSSRWQATLGKRVCGMRVTDLSGRRIGIGRATGRYFAKYVSWALLGIGFLMIGWTRRKQGLHDMMAGTLVMRRREADPVFTFNEPRA